MPFFYRSGRATFVAVLLILLSSTFVVARQKPVADVSTPEQIKAEFASVPCKQNERLDAVRALFERMGAQASDIKIEKFKAVENLVVRKEGETAETLVVGAHYDSISAGCGAIDNWTGIVALAHLYRSLKDVPVKKTLLFVAFGKEEKGLVGSRAMVTAIGKPQLGQFCAMVNLDSFGLATPQALDNASTPKLRNLAAEVAKELKIPFAHAAIGAADADSSSFVQRQIPAITLHGLSSDYEKVIHTHNDRGARVNAASVFLGYRLALELLVRLDESSCGAYR